METTMTNAPAPLDPIAQMVAKYQSNGHPTVSTGPQLALRPRKRKGWTGFRGKTLWDWLNLLGVFLIPVVIAAASIWFSVQQNLTSLQLSDKQHQSDQAIALDQQRATVLKSCMDDMTELLLHEGLRESQANASVRIIARAKTLAGLSQLDGERKGTLVRFLYEAQLIGVDPPNRIVSLRGADLSGANLEGTKLTGVDLIA